MPKLLSLLVAVAFVLAGAVTAAQAQSREQIVAECRSLYPRAGERSETYAIS